MYFTTKENGLFTLFPTQNLFKADLVLNSHWKLKKESSVSCLLSYLHQQHSICRHDTQRCQEKASF